MTTVEYKVIIGFYLLCVAGQWLGYFGLIGWTVDKGLYSTIGYTIGLVFSIFIINLHKFYISKKNKGQQ